MLQALNSERPHLPISPVEAAEAVANGAWLYNVEIASLRELLKAVAVHATGQKICFAGCVVKRCECRGMDVPNGLDFSPVTQPGADERLRSRFDCTADFAGVRFRHPVVFRGVFGKAADFTGATFVHEAAFSDARFMGPVVFDDASFEGEAMFVLTNFDSTADFRATRFARTAQFSGAMFTRACDFAAATFEGSAFFLAATFKRASFFGATFGELTRFVGAFIREKLVLEYAKVNGLMDLHVDPGRILQRGRAWLNLSEIDLRGAGRVVIPKELIGKQHWDLLRARWLQPPGLIGRWMKRGVIRLHHWTGSWFPSIAMIEGEESDDPAMLRSAAAQYNMLRDNFRVLPSKEVEEDRCHYKFKDLTRRSAEGNHIWRFFDWFVMKWLLGYGIYTRRVFCTAIGLVLLYAAIYQLSYRIWGDGIMHSQFSDRFNGLYFSIITFSTVGYGDYSPRGFLRFVAGSEGLLGMVLLSVLTVSFARKLIR